MRSRSRLLAGGLAAGMVAAAGAVVTTLSPAAADTDSCPWVHSSATPGQRADMVLAKMSLDDEIAMVHGAGGSRYVGFVPANPRLCIPALTLEDGPAGVADGMTGVTQLPAPVAGAASWDPSLMRRYGAVIGAEEKGKGANVALAPTINIVRDPRWGRAFESMSEDPYLTSRMGAADIEGIQSQGIMAQAKHWAVYNQETFRNTPADNAIVDERTEHEIYLPAFDAAVHQADVASVMCSYSTVNGSYACQNSYLLHDVLKDSLHFHGFVTSDWGATHSTVDSANAGLDMQMPGGSYFGAPLKAAVQNGSVPRSRLDDMVHRILAEMFRFGFFDHPVTGDPDATVTTAAHAAFARRAAEQGTVLLRNTGHTLPLDTATTHSIAVIGQGGGKNAMTAGGGSASVRAPYVVTPYQAITQRAGSGVTVGYAPGTRSGAPPAIPTQYLTPASGSGHGLTGQYFANQDLTAPAALTRTDAQVDFDWGRGSPDPGLPVDHFSAQWTGTLTPPATGTYTLALTSDDGSRLYVDGTLAIDNWRDQASHTQTTTMHLTAGQPVDLRVQYYENGGDASVSLGWQPPSAQSPLQQAVALARKSDVAVVFADKFESEGSDLADISLPDDQNALIEAVAKANPHTIVVLNTGSAVTMPWIDDVRGVLEAWYPGQEDGNAIASILFGDTDPSDRLPVTFPTSLSQVPAGTSRQWPGVDGDVHYSEKLLVGYRWYDAHHLTPLFPFGYGLSYTHFRYDHLRIAPAHTGDHGRVTVTLRVTNTGSRTGATVPQVYVSQPDGTGEPPHNLVAFDKVTLTPGQSRAVVFHLGRPAFRHWDSAAHGWAVAAGDYHIAVGRSSRDLPLTGTVTVR